MTQTAINFLSKLSLNSKKAILSLFAVITMISSTEVTFAAEYSSCNNGIFPNIVICGRTSQTACSDDSGRDMTKPCTAKDFVEVLARVLWFGITFILILIPLLIMFFGFNLILNQDKAVEKLKWKERVQGAFIGLLVVFCAWLIIKTIVTAFGVRSDIPNLLLDKNGSPTNLQAK